MTKTSNDKNCDREQKPVSEMSKKEMRELHNYALSANKKK